MNTSYQTIRVNAQPLYTIPARNELSRAEALLPPLEPQEERVYIDHAGNCATCIEDIDCARYPIIVYRLLRSTSVLTGQYVVAPINDQVIHKIIVTEVCKYFVENEEEVLSSSRLKDLVRARMYIFYLSVLYTNLSLHNIGRLTGSTHYATVLHHLGKAEKLEQMNYFTRSIEELHQRLSQHHLKLLRHTRRKHDYPSPYIRQISNLI